MTTTSAPLSIPIRDLTDFAEKTQHPRQAFDALKVFPLGGGFVASGVYRLDMEYRLAASQVETLSFVQKYTQAAEVRVMQLLSDDLKLDEIPAVISCYRDTQNPEANGSSWFVSPFYEGDLLTSTSDMPLSIVKVLAAVHAAYSGQAEHFDWLPHLDLAFIKRLIQYVLSTLNQHKERLPDSLVTEIQSQFADEKNASVLSKVYEHLPKTLTHGDVHSGNIVRIRTGGHVLMDWGNARIAPAIYDLANMVTMGSENWRAYLSYWEARTGETFDPELARLGYYWGTAVVNIQYLPYAMGYLPPTAVREMIVKLQNAIQQLEQ